MRRPLVAALALTALCACQSSGVEIPQGYEALKPCKYGRTIEVEDLADVGKPGCNMAGTTIRFSDGSCHEVKSVGGNNSWSYLMAGDEGSTIPKQFGMVNWGVPGVAVSEFDKQERLRRIWATSKDAYNLQREGDGEPVMTEEWEKVQRKAHLEPNSVWTCPTSDERQPLHVGRTSAQIS